MYFNKSLEGPSSGRDYRTRQKVKSKKGQKLSKLIEPHSDSEDESEHELSYYINDRVKLMKEVLKIIKPRKMKSMAPECMKNMDIQEINSILLEELLGISNKRLKYIFEAKVLEEESSTDEDQPVDVISLDSISDDDFVVISDDEEGKQRRKHNKRKKIKEEPKSKSKKVKKEKPDKDNAMTKEKVKKRRKEIDQVREKLRNKEDITHIEKETMGEENLMSVLELLELQARARAIRSQLELESKRKKEEQQSLEEEKRAAQRNGKADEEDEIIIEVPREVEIVIASSDSENGYKENVRAPSKTLEPSREISSVASAVVDESSQDSQEIDLITQKLDEPGVSLIHTGDKEDGEVVSDDEKSPISDKKDDKVIAEEIGKDEVNIETTLKTEGDSDSSSSSNENLLVVKEREQRKRHQEKSQEHCEAQPSETIANAKKIGKPEEQTTNKLDKVVEEFMKTQPPPPDNSEELRRLEEEEKKRQKNRKDKKKKLNIFKNKLESFKQDVAVESTGANVTVLENIVIKPKEVDVKGKSLEHSDDLVINVDQDDYDCMICD